MLLKFDVDLNTTSIIKHIIIDSMGNKFHDKAYDEATKLKLELFKECFREWLPVFIFNKQVTKIYIYDFFAGKGFDIDGYPGSPVLLFEEAKGKDCSVCNSLNGKEIVFAFNDKDNSDCLEKAVSQYVSNCQLSFCKKNSCNFQIYYGNHSFKDAFNGEKVQKILNQPDYAKFILLDQFGFKEVEEDIFIKLTKAPKTDFIFFIASSFIDRFKQHPAVKKYFDTSQIEFDNVQPKERHRLIANYFKRLIDNREYYIHHFTIKKGGNYYGLYLVVDTLMVWRSS